MRDGRKMIAIGLVLTYKDRQAKVAALNDLIDSCTDSIRSSGDLDGMPHVQGVSDPIAKRLEKIEKLEAERDRQQERLDAVDWAKRYVSDFYKDEYAPLVIKAILTSFNGNDDAARAMLDGADVSLRSFRRAKGIFINQICKYLKI